MSTVLMGQCWPLEMPPSAKAVLISLADQANDAGVCWPAIGTICKRTCLSERTVQTAISWLCESGVLLLNRTPGRSTNYQINPAGFGAGTVGLFDAPPRGDNGKPRNNRTPAITAPPQTSRGVADAPTPAATAPTPANAAPRTVKNRQGTSKEKFDAAAIELPEWLDRELWVGWCDERRSRGKTITERGAKEQLKSLAEFRRNGHTPERVISHAIASGNQGLYQPPVIRGQAGAVTESKVIEVWKGRPPLTPEERAASELAKQRALSAIKIIRTPA